MPSKTNREGYLQIDHRDSPGVDASLLLKTNKQAEIVGAGQQMEAAVLTCSHCQGQVVRNPARQRERHYCRSCDHYICDTCAAVMKNSGGTCSPFAKLLDKVATQAAHRSYKVLETIRELRRSILQ